MHWVSEENEYFEHAVNLQDCKFTTQLALDCALFSENIAKNVTVIYTC